MHVKVLPDDMRGEVERLWQEVRRQPAERDPNTLLLIGRRRRNGINSWLRAHRDSEHPTEAFSLLINPEDARILHIADRDSVRVRSAVGEIVVIAVVSADIMQGVVSLPHSIGLQQPVVDHLNVVTHESRVDAFSGTAAFSGVPVTVHPA
jgi:anaerobic selenocysteine-containing dehydrogenase